MNPSFILTFVSVLASAHVAPATQPAPRNTVSVRSLVQGSGTVIVFDNAADMSHKAVSK